MSESAICPALVGEILSVLCRRAALANPSALWRRQQCLVCTSARRGIYSRMSSRTGMRSRGADVRQRAGMRGRGADVRKEGRLKTDGGTHPVSGRPPGLVHCSCIARIRRCNAPAVQHSGRRSHRTRHRQDRRNIVWSAGGGALRVTQGTRMTHRTDI